jgi:hypothetical protein
MDIIYINKTCIIYEEILHHFNKLNEYISKPNKLGSGTYCSTYKITDKLVLKVYPANLNFEPESNSFSSEIDFEIDFIKKNNDLDIIANTYLITKDQQNNLFIIQEFLSLKSITHLTYNIFLCTLNYYIKILYLNIKLLQNNYINLDIKPQNMGFDNNNNLKLFDMNLLLEISNSTNKINLFDKYDYYYLHPVINIEPKNIISYSIGILILEAFSTSEECNEFLYKPKRQIHSKYVLLNNKKNILGSELFKILHNSLSGKLSPTNLLQKFIKIYKKKTTM